ncbi:anti-sigma factor RsbA family regulatory protein [Mycobacterium sp. pUA109]|uniref:anti-sigma factor RsbA family regulatory protein n=1 Tax=Mycobacterium sp. pUA109 TaxID=3238982 RepID=UPI00351B87DF
MTTTTTSPAGAFAHPALCYRSQQDYLDCLVPFIRSALGADYPVLVAVPEPNLSALREALGDAAAAITLVDMARGGRNPGHILGGVLGTFAAKHAPRPVRMIGEPIWAGRSADEYAACVQHEALINRAFAGQDVAIVCPYDVTALPSNVIADAHGTHPVLWEVGLREQDSPAFAPEAVWSRYNQPLPRNPAAVSYAINQLADLSEARAFAARYARRFGLGADGIADLQMIVTELAANSVQYTPGPCTLALWRHDGHVVCEVRDPGYLDDPLAGRRPMDRDSARGRGLFVVNAVADLVRAHITPHGTTVQAQLRLTDETC